MRSCSLASKRRCANGMSESNGLPRHASDAAARVRNRRPSSSSASSCETALASPVREQELAEANEVELLQVVPEASPVEGAPHKYLIAFAVVLAALMQVI